MKGSGLKVNEVKEFLQSSYEVDAPPRSYGRRHRSWHYEPQAQTNC
jgi:hypothetical protein